MKYSVLFFSALFFFSCGLPTIPYLTPITSINTSIIEFEHPTANGDVDGFQGYDIYYRLQTSSQIDTDEINYINDYENPDVSPLTSRGFHMVAVADSITNADFVNVEGPDDGPAVGYAYSSEAYIVKIERKFLDPSDSDSEQLWISLTRENDDVEWTRILLRSLTEDESPTYESFIGDYDGTEEDFVIPGHTNDDVYVLFAAVPRALNPEYGLSFGSPRLISTEPLQVYP